MDELAVVREQQQAGGVLVQPPDRLHLALAQRHRQQVVHAGMVARALRALVAHRLVQQDIGLGVADPFLAVHGQAQAVDLELGARILAQGAVDLHQAGPDQITAIAAGTEALGLEDAVECHGHGLILDIWITGLLEYGLACAALRATLAGMRGQPARAAHA